MSIKQVLIKVNYELEVLCGSFVAEVDGISNANYHRNTRWGARRVEGGGGVRPDR